MYPYLLRPSASFPGMVTVCYRDEETGEIVALLNSKARPLTFNDTAHAARYVARIGGYVEEEA